MKLDKDTALKSLVSFLGIILVCLICILSLLDAPEYAHCTHIGVCEFLELSGNLGSHKGIENLIKAQKNGFLRLMSFQQKKVWYAVSQEKIICP